MELYTFFRLKEQVTQAFKVNPDEVESNFIFTQIKRRLNIEDIRRKVNFERDREQGIFYEEDGRLYKGFLYIASYNQIRAEINGFNTLPTFHVTKCKIITRQMKRDNFNGHYVFQNAIVFMKDIDGEEKDLRICGYCRKEIGLSSMHTTEYYNNYIKNEAESGNFQAKDLPIEYERNLWGYTPNWHKTSKAYREKQKFTCESCGIRLDGANGWYLDTHHISGNKTNSQANNLKCLCVLCHANVDELHRKNFSTGRNKKRLDDFLKHFRSQLARLKNQYL